MSRPRSKSRLYQDTSWNFLLLPREIRDEIYRYALIAEGMVEVFHAEDEYDQDEGSFKLVIQEDACRRSLDKCSPNLLRTCKTVYSEATRAFYGQNTFCFVGPHDWQMEVDWLRMIGKRNVCHLTSLVFAMRSPSLVHQYPDGTRKVINDEWLGNNAHHRNPLLRFPAKDSRGRKGDFWERGSVPDIDPLWENVFSLLGDGLSDAPKLTLRIDNMHPGHPGAMENLDVQSNAATWYSMDLPNVLESWRATHSSDTSVTNRTLDVLWRSYFSHGSWPDDDFFEDLDFAGWDVIRRYPQGSASFMIAGSEKSPRVTMRHKPLDGPIVADRPNPYEGGNWSSDVDDNEDVDEDSDDNNDDGV